MNRTSVRAAVAAAALFCIPFLPAIAETRIEKSLRLDPGSTLNVVSDAGNVTVTGSSRSDAHVLLTSNRDDLESKFDVKFEELPGEVRITMKKKAETPRESNDGRIAFDIQVPARTRTDLATRGGHISVESLEGDSELASSGGHIQVVKLTGNLVGKTSGGHITLKSISGDARVETSGGHIDADGIDGNLRGRTSGGHIEVARVGKDIDVETSGGGIEIRDARGRVEAETSGGGVEVSFAKGNSRGGRIESSGGDVRVSLDPEVNLNLDASSSGGSVRSDIPVKVVGKLSGSSVKGSLGAGGELLFLHTSGGSVTLSGAGGWD
jgi:hypothetical protein